MKIKMMAAVVLAVCGVGSASAASLYPDVGTQNPVAYTFEAVATGDVTATLVSADAAYNEYIYMDTWPSGFPGPLNHDPVGTSFSLGPVVKNQVVTFYIYITGNHLTYSSNPARNPDGLYTNHVYVKQDGKDLLLSFEDLPSGHTDWDYNDAVYRISNVAVVPEPGNVALLLAGLGALGAMARRRRSVS